MSELTQKQIDRQDFVDNAIYALVNDLVPDKYRIQNSAGEWVDKPELEWNIEWIGEIRDTIVEIYARYLPYFELNKLTTPEEILKQTDEFNAAFYPYIELDLPDMPKRCPDCHKEMAAAQSESEEDVFLCFHCGASMDSDGGIT